MEKIIYIEVIDRLGRVRRRTKVTSFPLSIGRAYGNDIILHNKYVSPQHISLSLSAEGELLLQDLGSRNGVFLNRERLENTQTKISSNDILRIGETTLRIRDADHPVAEAALQHHYIFRARRRINTSVVGLICYAVACLAVVLLQTLATPSLTTTGRLVSDGLLSLLVLSGIVFAWSGVWALATAVILHQSSFWAHLSIASLTLIVLSLGSLLLKCASFSMALPILYTGFGIACLTVLATVLLYAHLCHCSKISRKKLFALSAAASAAALSLLLVNRYITRSEYSTELDFHPVLMSRSIRTVTPATVTEFVSDATDLKDKLDEL